MGVLLLLESLSGVLTFAPADSLRLFSRNLCAASMLYAPAGGVLVLLALTLSRFFLPIDWKVQDCLLFQGLLSISSGVNFL